MIITAPTRHTKHRNDMIESILKGLKEVAFDAGLHFRIVLNLIRAEEQRVLGEMECDALLQENRTAAPSARRDFNHSPAFAGRLVDGF